jgi:hypothetical protein
LHSKNIKAMSRELLEFTEMIDEQFDIGEIDDLNEETLAEYFLQMFN